MCARMYKLGGMFRFYSWAHLASDPSQMNVCECVWCFIPRTHTKTHGHMVWIFIISISLKCNAAQIWVHDYCVGCAVPTRTPTHRTHGICENDCYFHQSTQYCREHVWALESFESMWHSAVAGLCTMYLLIMWSYIYISNEHVICWSLILYTYYIV